MASFHSNETIAPSKLGIKQLALNVLDGSLPTFDFVDQAAKSLTDEIQPVHRAQFDQKDDFAGISRPTAR